MARFRLPLISHAQENIFRNCRTSPSYEKASLKGPHTKGSTSLLLFKGHGIQLFATKIRLVSRDASLCGVPVSGLGDGPVGKAEDAETRRKAWNKSASPKSTAKKRIENCME